MPEPGSPFGLSSRDGVPGLGQTWGALLIGTAIGVSLNVFTLILAYKYFRLYPTDARFLRCIVIIVLPLDLFQTIADVYACCWHLVTNHSDPSAIFQENWSFIAFGPASIWTIVGCQIFYAYRVFRFASYYRWLALLASIGMGISLTFDISTCSYLWPTNILTELLIFALLVESYVQRKPFSAAISIVTWSVHLYSVEAPNLFALAPITWLATGIYGSILSTDVILTCTLVFVLARKRTGRRRTDTVIASLIAYTVSSGLLSTIISTVSFLFTLIQRGNLIFCAFTAFGVKVYVMSMLTAIILRKTFSMRMGSDDIVTTTVSNWKESGGNRSGQTQLSVGGVSNIVFAPVASTSQSGAATTTTGQGSSWDARDSTDWTTASY